MSDSGRLLRAVAAIITVELIGNAGSIFTLPSITGWYASLSKPWFTPPNWAFGPAWTILFALMGLSAWLVWERRRKDRNADSALRAFGLQLALNVLWSLLFFGLRSPLYGLIGIYALIIAIIYAMVKFRKVSGTAFALMVPYLLWVTFASFLNLYVLLLN